MSSVSKINVAVLRGGPSHWYDTSLATGKKVLSILHSMEDKYKPVDIFISRDGEWHNGGIVHEPHQALDGVDVVWNALHGTYGEDGQVQRILEDLGLRYTGSDESSSILSINKEMAKELYRKHDMHTPQHELLVKNRVSETDLINIFRSYIHPVIVKPANGSGWLGVRPAHTYHDLKKAVEEAFAYSHKVMVEEFVRGKAASCAVVEGARGETLYALVPVELGPEEDLCPGSFTVDENKMMESMARRAHSVLGMRHYSVSDFIVSPKGRIYIIETNSQPGLHDESLIHKALPAVGWRTDDFVHHVIELALK